MLLRSSNLLRQEARRKMVVHYFIDREEVVDAFGKDIG